MRKLGYQTVDGDKGITVFSFEAKKKLEKMGLTMHEVLIDIPEERGKIDFKPWVVVNGELVRQHV